MGGEGFTTGAASVFLVGPNGVTSVLLANQITSSFPPDGLTQPTVFGGGATTPIGFLTTFTAANLSGTNLKDKGTWKLEIKSPPGQPATLNSWSLPSFGRSFVNPNSFTGTDIISPITVSGVDPGLSSGQGGNVIVNATRVHVLDGSSINAQTTGIGPAGDVDLNAYSLVVSGKDSAGTPSFVGSSSILPPNGGSLDERGLGAAGDVNIDTAGSTLVENGGELTVEENGNKSAGGNINVTAFDLRLVDGEITAA